MSRGSAGTNAAKIQIIIDTPKILRRKKYTGSFFIQLNLHNPLNFSVLRNFIVFFLRIPIFLRTFAPISNVEFKSERNMEEKKYHIDESKIAGDKVCEPSPAYASVASESVSHHVIDSGIEQEDEIPVLKNHFSYEGLLDSIDYCETIKDDPSKWESVDAFNERLYEEFPWLR